MSLIKKTNNTKSNQYLITNKEIGDLIELGIAEDLGQDGDITSLYTISSNKNIRFQIVNREPIVLCGIDIALKIFSAIDKKFKTKTNIKTYYQDGKFLPENTKILEGFGNAIAIFAAERLALNLIQHLSGIATTTNQYIKKLTGETKILDTRKTIIGLRKLQKYAVRTGGGANHRLALYDGILIKDNHIAACGGVKKAIDVVRKNLAKNNIKIPIEVECDNLSQVKEALIAKAEIIMLDNMNLSQIKKAVSLINKRAKIEVSGGINLKKISAISKAGVDYISVGALTHSVKAVDIGLDIIQS